MSSSLLLESLFVGAYCALLSCFVNHPFLFGFTKHALGYLMGLHALFCKERQRGNSALVSWSQIIKESVLEGFVVMGMCVLLGRKMLSYFIVGVVLHLGSEYLKLHENFLKRCRWRI